MSWLKNIRKSKFLVDFLFMLSSNISLLFIGILVSIIKNRILGPEGMGFYAILTNFSLLFVSMAELGIRQSTIYFAGKGTFSLSRILSANVNIWLFSSLIGIIIFYIIFRSNNIQVSRGLLIVSSLIIPSMIANSFISGVMLGADKIQKTANYNFINGLFNLIAVALFVWVLKLGVFGALLAFLITTTTLTFRKYYFLKAAESIKFKFTFELEVIKKLIGHGIIYGLALFLITNQKKVPILLMTGRLSEFDIGIYNAGFTFASLLYNVYNAVSAIIFIRSAKAKDSVANSLNVQKLMRVVFIILLLISAILYFALDFLIPWMYGTEFIGSIEITRILFIGIIFYNVFLILNMDLAGRGRPIISIYALIPVTVINILSNFFFIDIFGIIGAAWSTSISLALGAVIFIFLYSKEVKISLWNIIKPLKSDWEFISHIFKIKGR